MRNNAASGSLGQELKHPGGGTERAAGEDVVTELSSFGPPATFPLFATRQLLAPRLDASANSDPEVGEQTERKAPSSPQEASGAPPTWKARIT